MALSKRLCRVNWNASRSCFGVSLLALVWLLGLQAVPAHARIIFPAPRFPFTIDPKTPLQELLPVPPDTVEPISPWLVREWSQVPEVFFQKTAAIKREAGSRPGSPEEEARRVGMTQALKEQIMTQAFKERQEAMKQTAHTIAKINHLNQKGADHFLKTLLEKRDDLVGLPFVMGDACRQSKERRLAFLSEVNGVRAAMQREVQTRPRPGDRDVDDSTFWTKYEKTQDDTDGKRKETVAEAREKTLARLAIFSFEEEVRRAALNALRTRPKQDSTDVLLAGLRYPWPAVASNAADALIHLGRKDLVPQLVALLDEPDPRAPADREVNGKKTLAVRELVRLNHHRNCLLCHAPGNSPDVTWHDFGGAEGILTGAVPSPGQSFNSPSRGGYDPFASPDISVRVDVTYLRQDFSLLQPVKDAAPWPDQQRFDFLVRTRPVTTEEAKAYRRWLGQQEPGYLSPNQRATLTALRTLTGRDVSEPSTKAWRSALGE